MGIEYVIGLAVSVVILVFLVYALLGRKSSEVGSSVGTRQFAGARRFATTSNAAKAGEVMTVNGWIRFCSLQR